MMYFEGLREQERENIVNYISEQMHCDQDGFDRAMYLCSEAIEEYVEYRIAERMENKK